MIRFTNVVRWNPLIYAYQQNFFRSVFLTRISAIFTFGNFSREFLDLEETLFKSFYFLIAFITGFYLPLIKGSSFLFSLTKSKSRSFLFLSQLSLILFDK